MDQSVNPQTIAGLLLTVTNGAQTLSTLVDAASTGSSAQWPPDLDAIDIRPENGDIRVTFHTSFTPTATAGRLIRQGEIAKFRKRNIKNMKLISTTSASVKVFADVGVARDGEDDTFTSSILGFGLFNHGELVGSATAIQLPNIAAKFVKFKARIQNTGNVYLGNSASVTVGAGSTSVTAGYELAPGDESPWIAVPGGSIQAFYRICNNATDHLTYITNND